MFMDVHTVEGGVSATDVAGAHQADLATQTKYGVDYMRYWVDEKAGKVFCLVNAPDADTAATVHPVSRSAMLVAAPIPRVPPVTIATRAIVLTSFPEE